MVFPDGTAKAPGALVAAKDGDALCLKLISRLQLVVGVIEAQCAMPLVGALLGDDIHQGCAIAAELRREIVGGNAHFLNIFGIRIYVGYAVALAGIDGSRVDEKAVGFCPRAIGVKIHTVLRIENVAARLRVSLSASAGQAGYTRRQNHQGVEVPAGEWEVVDLLLRNLTGHAGLRGLDRRSFVGYRHRRVSPAHHHTDVDRLDFSDRQLNMFLHGGLESLRGDADRERRGSQSGEAERTGVLGLNRLGGARFLILDRDRGPRHHRARGVADRAFDAAGELCPGGSGVQHHQNQKYTRNQHDPSWDHEPPPRAVIST